MSKTPIQDAVVVGGGPAGLATAIELTRRGAKVTVVDAAEPGADKACGEGLMPDGVSRLEEVRCRDPTRQPGKISRYSLSGQR